MITLLSPSKGQDFASPPFTSRHTLPAFGHESESLIHELRKLGSRQLQELMAISEKIADVNVERYRQFQRPFTRENSKQALCAFSGDVYNSLKLSCYSEDDFIYAQDHLFILSGLYGCLRPLDLIQPYRLEMKTKLANKRGSDLYGFWGERITDIINSSLTDHGHKVVVNLASQEYFKVVHKKKLAGQLLTVIFKEIKDGKARVVAIYAKRARGMMADFIVRQKIDEPEGLRDFNNGGYRFDEKQSDQRQYIFVRPQPSNVHGSRLE